MIAKQDGREIPKHIAVIMDGNGRWAKKQGAMRIFGHRSGVQAVRDITEGCAELGVGSFDALCFFYRKLVTPSKGSRWIDEFVD